MIFDLQSFSFENPRKRKPTKYPLSTLEMAYMLNPDWRPTGTTGKQEFEREILIESTALEGKI